MTACNNGDIGAKAKARAFFKSCESGSAWFEIPIQSLELEDDPKLSSVIVAGVPCEVAGVQVAMWKIEVYKFDTTNIERGLYNFRPGANGQIQVYETDPPVDARKFVTDVRIGKFTEKVYEAEGATMISTELKQSGGKHYRPGVPASPPSTYYGDNYATINPTGAGRIMPPASPPPPPPP